MKRTPAMFVIILAAGVAGLAAGCARPLHVAKSDAELASMRVVEYGYDARGDLATEAEKTGSYHADFSYDRRGWLKSLKSVEGRNSEGIVQSIAVREIGYRDGESSEGGGSSEAPGDENR